MCLDSHQVIQHHRHQPIWHLSTLHAKAANKCQCLTCNTCSQRKWASHDPWCLEMQCVKLHFTRRFVHWREFDYTLSRHREWAVIPICNIFKNGLLLSSDIGKESLQPVDEVLDVVLNGDRELEEGRAGTVAQIWERKSWNATYQPDLKICQLFQSQSCLN